MADIFNDTIQQTGGLYASDYLWSAAGNWSNGRLPVTTDAVTVNLSTTKTSVVDGTISVASVGFSNSGSLLIGGSLTASGSMLLASGNSMSVLAKGSLQVNGTLTLSGGTLDLAGSASIANLALNTGSTFTIEGNSSVAQIGGGSVTIGRGGALEVTTGTNSNLSAGGDLFTLNGGSLKLDGSVLLLAGSGFTFGAASLGTSALYIGDMANFTNGSLSNSIRSFDLGDSLQFGNTTFSSATYSSNSHSLILKSSGSTSTYTLTNFTVAAGVAGPGFSLGTAANGGTILTLNCFLAGTRIETEGGLVAIEALSVGDLVVTIEHGARLLKPIRWIGACRVDVSRMDDDMAREAAPVRIRAHAFADGIPARMLVNGTSILRETDRVRYDVYHLEFETHSILLSEGLTTESYLDTGSRAGFGLPDACRVHLPNWAEDAAAPLVTAREAVEPVWRRLAERAETLGQGVPQRSRVARTTQDPALCVRLENGVLLRARRRRGERHFFVLPAGGTHAALQSRSAVPAEIEGPFVDDRRRLGVCVRGVKLWNDLRSTVLVPGGDGLPGWHRPEQPGGCRWTDGSGALRLPVLLRPTVLEVELACVGRYELPEDQQQLLSA